MPAGGYRAVKKEGTQTVKLHPLTPPPTPDLPLQHPPVPQKPSQGAAHQPLQNSLPMAAAAAPGGWLAGLSEPVVNISGWVPQQPAAALGYGVPAQQLPCSIATDPGQAVGTADAAVCGHVIAAAVDSCLFCSERLDTPSGTPADTPEQARRTSAASCHDAWHPWASQQTQKAGPQHAALRPAAILRHSARLSVSLQPVTPLAGFVPTPQRPPPSPGLDDDLLASFLNDGPDSGLSSRCGFGSEDTTAARM
jgi:hypothetical protein